MFIWKEQDRLKWFAIDITIRIVLKNKSLHILKVCFIVTTSIMIYIGESNPFAHYSVLPVSKGHRYKQIEIDTQAYQF